MTIDVRRDGEHPRRSWLNGEGVTAEIAGGPPGSDAGSAFDWRVSLAEVTGSCDFSSFAEVDRVIVLVAGPGIELRFGDHTQVLRLFEPYAFDGAETLRCEVEQPVRCLNVMTRRGRATASVEVVRLLPGEPGRSLAAADPQLVAALDGTVLLAGTATTLYGGDVVVADEPVGLTGDGHAAVVRVSRPA